MKILKKLYDVFPYMNIHYFHFINQTLSLKLKAHFREISFQKAVVLHLFYIRIIDFFNGFTNLFILTKLIIKINKCLYRQNRRKRRFQLFAVFGEGNKK